MGPQLPSLMASSSVFGRLTADGQVIPGPEIISYFDSLARTAPDPVWAQKLRDTAAELLKGDGLTAHTSGTTGPPKEYLIPERDLLASAHLTRAAFDLEPGDRVLHCLPCDFVAGKLMLVRGCALALDMHFVDPSGSLFHSLEPSVRFRFTAMVPLQLHRLLNEDRERVERQFDTILLGGGPVSEALSEALQGLSTRVFISYGSTETVTHVALRALNGAEPSDVFTALGTCHFARDPRGCLVVYTPHLSTTQHVTNDLVSLLDDTHFRWLGRYDNVILSGGKKVFPEQLEAKTAGLIPYPHYFRGVADAVLGQAIVLVVETDRPEHEVLPDIMEKMMFTLERHEWPRRVVTLPKIERTSGGKLVRYDGASTT